MKINSWDEDFEILRVSGNTQGQNVFSDLKLNISFLKDFLNCIVVDTCYISFSNLKSQYVMLYSSQV